MYLVSGGFQSILVPVAQQLNIPVENIIANRIKFYFNGMSFSDAYKSEKKIYGMVEKKIYFKLKTHLSKGPLKFHYYTGHAYIILVSEITTYFFV